MDHKVTRHAPSSIVTWIVMLSTLPVLYVFSIGPVWALEAKGIISENERYQRIYPPLFYVAENNTFFADALENYITFWFNLSGVKPPKY